MSTWQEQLQGAHAEVINDFKEKWREISGGPSIADTLTAFVSAVDWTVSAREVACCLAREGEGYDAPSYVRESS